MPPRPPRDATLAFADDAEVAAAYAELRSRTEPVPAPAASSSGESPSSRLPRSLAELRALPIKALKQAMVRLGLSPTPGSEKEDLVNDIAAHMDMAREGDDA